MNNANQLLSPDAGLVLTKAVLNTAARLGLNSRALGQTLGCSEATISRLRSGKVLAPESKEGQLALLLIRVYRSLSAILGGNDEQVQQWFHAANRDVQGVPAEQVESVEGLVGVVQYLDAMRARI